MKEIISITGDTPILCKYVKDNTFFYKTIESLELNYQSTKKKCNLLIWNGKEFTQIIAIAKSETKTTFRVRTTNGVLDISEFPKILKQNDGSDVLDPSVLCEAPPGKLPIDCRGYGSASKDIAWLYGLFYAYGTINTASTWLSYETVVTWSINHIDNDRVKRGMSILKDCCAGVKNTTINFVDNYISTTDKPIISWYRHLFYDGNIKKIPGEILNGTFDVKTAFCNGCGNIDSDETNKLGSAGLVYIWNTINKTRSKSSIKTVEEIINEEYMSVYSIKTESGFYMAGIGNLVINSK